MISQLEQKGVPSVCLWPWMLKLTTLASADTDYDDDDSTPLVVRIRSCADFLAHNLSKSEVEVSGSGGWVTAATTPPQTWHLSNFMRHDTRSWFHTRFFCSFARWGTFWPWWSWDARANRSSGFIWWPWDARANRSSGFIWWPWLARILSSCKYTHNVYVYKTFIVKYRSTSVWEHKLHVEGNIYIWKRKFRIG